MSENLRCLHDRATRELRKIAKQRFFGQNDFANSLRKRYRISLEQATGVISVLSPESDWSSLVTMARRVLDAYEAGHRSGWDSQMDEACAGGLAHLFRPDPEIGHSLNRLESIRGRSLAELSSSRDKAIWIRIYAERFREPVTEVDGSGNPPKGLPAGHRISLRWSGLSAIANAVAILESGSTAQIGGLLGICPRVRHLYNNIVSPFSREPFVTVDPSLIAAALVLPMCADSFESGQALGAFGLGYHEETGEVGTYELYVAAVATAAQKLGYLFPGELATICSEVAKVLFRNAGRIESSYAVAAAMWSAVEYLPDRRNDARSAIIDWAFHHTGRPESNSWTNLPEKIKSHVPERTWDKLFGEAEARRHASRSEHEAGEPERRVGADQLEFSHCYTGLGKVMRELGLETITRTQLLRADYGDQVPLPWTGEMEIRLPVELQDAALRISPDLMRQPISAT